MKRQVNAPEAALRERRLAAGAAVLLALVAAGLYLPMLRADFVWDAVSTVVTNRYVHGLQHLPDLLTLRSLRLDMIDNNRPVFLFSAMIDWAIWGKNAAGFHLTNLLLHALVTVLLFTFARRLMPSAPWWVPFSGALLFAVHPLNCEAVAEISYRKDLIAAAGILGALHFAAVFHPRLSPRNFLAAGACLACLFLAVGVKENGVAGPPALLCYWLLFRRTEPRAGWIFLCAAGTLIVTAFLVARFALQPFPSVIFTRKPPQLGGSFSETLLIQPRIWAFYLRQIVLPMNLCADYAGYSIRNFNLLPSLAGLAFVAGLQVFIALKNRVACLGAVLFWLSLLPVSNFIPIYRPMADRFLYLPMCGAALLLAGVLGAPKLRSRTAAATVLTLILSTACVFATATFRRESVWMGNGALWRDTVEKNPLSFSAANNLADALIKENQPGAAVAAAERAIQLSEARDPDPFALLAVALDRLGRTAEADDAFRKAVALDVRYRTPEALVRALTWDEEMARKLALVAARYRN